MDSVPLLLRILRGTMIRDHFGPHLLGRFWFGLQDKSLLSSWQQLADSWSWRKDAFSGQGRREKTPQAWGGNHRKKHHRRRKHPVDANNMAYRSKIHALRPGPSQQNTSPPLHKTPHIQTKARLASVSVCGGTKSWRGGRKKIYWSEGGGGASDLAAKSGKRGA